LVKLSIAGDSESFVGVEGQDAGGGKQDDEADGEDFEVVDG
jgi:hypothetical protein